MMEYGVKVVILLGVAAGVLMAEDTCESDRCDDIDSAFDGLTEQEIRNVMKFMEEQNLNIIDINKAKPEWTYINIIDAGTPNKKEMLNHLDNGAEMPERWARVILYRGSASPPVIEEYKVWPLPDVTNLEKIKLFGKDSLSYNHRAWFADVELRSMDTYIEEELSNEKIKNLLSHHFDGFTYGGDCAPKCLTFLPGMPGSVYRKERSVWLWIVKRVEGMYLNPIGLQVKVIADSPSYSNWTLTEVNFLGKRYPHLQALQTLPGARSPTKRSTDDNITMTTDNPEDESVLFSSLNTRGDLLPENDRRGPETYMPDGRRYKVRGQRVEWQGWQFNFAMRSISGIRMFDIRFKGNRIVYEMKLSEMAAVYTGRTPAPQHTYYLDSGFLFGMESFELIKGVDCPCYADYFDFAHFFGGQATTFKNSACLFEWNMGTPLRRHYDTFRGEFQYFQGMPDNALIFRSILTVVNYEYIFDFVFHQNGGMELVISQSGYVAAHYYTDQRDDKYGFQLHENVIGNIHHHIFNFKVDLDVLHQNNNFETVDLKLEKEPDQAETLGREVYLQVKEHSLKTNELDAAYKYNFSTPKYLLFYNRDSQDRLGNHRAYRLLLNSPSYFLFPQDWPATAAFAWANYQVAVTKRKEEEDSSSSIYSLMNMQDPPIKFQKFLDDNEDITNEDLVAWVTLGVHHIPHTEDIPIVQTTGAKNSFYLLPYNFFPHDPSESSRDNVRMDPEDVDKEGRHHLKYSGSKPDVTCSGCALMYLNMSLICLFFIVCLM